MQTEAEFEETQDVVAGRARLAAALAKIGRDEQDAFWEAVRRCYASAVDEETAATESA